ncbi:MAG: TIGR01777 family oxidoreductase [Saprospiraceae bacterium]
MKTVLITGGTGLLGSRLSQLLKIKGYRVTHLSRRRNLDATFPAYQWDIQKGEIETEALTQADYIITLAGAGIADRRWTAARKKLIIDSRVNGIRLIKKELEALNHHPKAIIGATATGYYGNAGSQLVDENASSGDDFLSESVREWEAAYDELATLNVRLPRIRVGIVLSTQGGALQKMLPTYKAGFRTYFGDGHQIYSWIHLDDICNIFIHAIENEEMTGIYNGVAPHPVSNKLLAKAIASAKNMNEVVLPAPAFVMKLVLGEMAAVVLSGSNISSKKIEATGFSFEHKEIVSALQDLLERKI